MSEENGKPLTVDAMMKPWVELWETWAQQNQEHLKTLASCTPPSVDVNKLRKQWLETVSRSLDSYVRSPSYLEAMRKNLEMVTTIKSTSEFAKRELARESGVPHAEDISGLFIRLETATDAIMAKLAMIEARLERLEQREAAARPTGEGGVSI